MRRQLRTSQLLSCCAGISTSKTRTAPSRLPTRSSRSSSASTPNSEAPLRRSCRCLTLFPRTMYSGNSMRARAHHILDALTRVILKESEREPVLIVLENLQWVDAETRVFLGGLIERIH